MKTKNGISGAFLDKVRLAADEYGMFRDAKVVTVALSGGKDSVSLLFALKKLEKEYGFTVRALHVNHSIRGKESDRDESFCVELCAKLGVEFESERVDAVAYSEKNGTGIEEAARILRYRAFGLRVSDGKKVATAHTSSDNLETVIFDLCRGASPDGLCGIPPVRDGFIRPLLFVSSEETLAFINENGLGFVTDSTNSDESYTRNFIRRQIVPLLKKVDPNVEERVSRTSRSLLKDKTYFSSLVEKELGDLSTGRLAILPDPILSRVIVSSYREKKERGEISNRNVLDAVDIIRRTASDGIERLLDLPGGMIMRCGREKISFSTGKEEKVASFSSSPLVFGMNEISKNALALITRDENDPRLRNYKIIYKLRAKNILENDTITVRARKNGDAYRSKGVTHKVKKLFSDAKLPLEDRASLPLFCDSKGVFWIPGFDARDDIFGNGPECIYIFYIKTGE